MKRLLVIALMSFIALGFESCAQSFGDVLNQGKKILDENTNTNGGGGITNSEVIAGLKQALEIGSKNAGGKLNVLDGYFGNQLIKILMPPEAQKVEKTLRDIGLGGQVDKAILRMNRAAEDAAVKAAPIFVNAIKRMTIQDGIGILKGGNGAATDYLKRMTTQELTNAFRPIINQSLSKVDATKYWSDVFNIYNKLPTTRQKINPDLTGYVTERALAGLFVTVAEEENKIRQNPAARVTDLLKKVFGNN